MTIQLNSCQKLAEQKFLHFLMTKDLDVMVIEGPAGTGKTTLVKHLIDSMPKYEKVLNGMGKSLPEFEEIAVTATTRKAAQVLAESFNVKPMTIHSYLHLVIKNDYRTGETKIAPKDVYDPKVVKNGLIFIDEASFVDDVLFDYITKQCVNCKLVYMGDPYQLKFVGAKTNPIFDAQPKLYTAELKTIVRNKGTISDLSAMYRNVVATGQFQPFTACGKQIHHLDGKSFQKRVDAAFMDKGYKADKTAKVVTWTNQRCLEYNDYIMNLRGVNDVLTVGETLICNKPVVYGETVVVQTEEPVKISAVRTKKKHGVNGTQVFVTKKDGSTADFFVPNSQEAVKRMLRVLAQDKNWSDYFEIKNTWGDLRPSYASTVHKAQGSTYETVFVDLEDIGQCQDPDDAARLLYVAVSRASKEVVLYGDLPDHYMGVTSHEFAQSVA